MKVVHICLSCFYIDGVAYQENQLVAEHVSTGHDVHVIASTETYDNNARLTYVSPGTYLGTDGAKVIRIPYRFNFFPKLSRKIRAYIGLEEILNKLKPEVILFHGLAAWELLTVAAYVKKHPEVKFFVDCHEDFNNSAKSLLSRELLHKRFYKPIFRKCIGQISEVLCVTPESLDFAIRFYNSDPAKTRIYPIGGVIESTVISEQRRTKFRSRFGFTDADLVVTQTGKLDHTKELALALKAFRENPSPLLKLVIAGRMTDEVREECMPIIEVDERIIYLGWQSPDELRTVLAGADFFLQPFGQTATTQMAMCYGCIILAQDLPSHRWLVGENGRLFKDATELDTTFKWIIENKESLDQLKKNLIHFAEDNLDYRKLALQIVS